jgi:hypothetical protein
MQKNFVVAAVGIDPNGRDVITLKRKCADGRHGTRLKRSFSSAEIIVQGMRLAVVKVQ